MILEEQVIEAHANLWHRGVSVGYGDLMAMPAGYFVDVYARVVEIWDKETG